MRFLNKIIILYISLFSGACSLRTVSSLMVAIESDQQISSKDKPTQNDEFILKTTPPAYIQVGLENNHIELTEEAVSKELEVEKDVRTNKTNILSTYYIKEGDTLMLISLNLLGDHMKWRSIQKWNKRLKASSDLIPGTILFYSPYEAQMHDQREGLPYLVKRNDTLPRISNKVYGRRKFWDVIYFNNKDFIKSPDLIYSGFILYYPMEELIPEIKIEIAASHINILQKREPASSKRLSTNKKFLQ